MSKTDVNSDYLSGGKLIGLGSYGCVFSPSILCTRKYKNDKTYVSKIYIGDQGVSDAKRELKINKLIKNINNSDKWAGTWIESCDVEPYNILIKHDPDIIKCLDRTNVSVRDFDKYSAGLVGYYAGKPINKLFTKSILTKSKFSSFFLSLMKLIKPLFVGLIDMYNNKIIHNDIKPDNIMVSDGVAKYIDFGLSAKYTETNLLKKRILSEFNGGRIYPPYPYEYIYMNSSRVISDDQLKEEKDNIEHGFYRGFHTRYKHIHETIFKRNNIDANLIELIDGILRGDRTRIWSSMIISKVDTYSIGVLIPNMLLKLTKTYYNADDDETYDKNKLRNLSKLLESVKVRPFIDLFKQMSEPDHHLRITPDKAYERYLELENIYLKSTKPSTKSSVIKKLRKKTVRKKGKRTKRNKTERR